MDLKDTIRRVLLEAHNKKMLNEEFKIFDLSSSSNYPTGSLKKNKYFILHHTAGRGSAQGVVNVLNKRKLGVQYVIDREGKIYKTTKGTRGAHATSFYDSAPDDLSNATAQGVEIIATNESDILINQCKSALMLVKYLGIPLSNVYGHGEVSSNKTRSEGATCKAYFKKYWNTVESELPTIDKSLNVGTENYGKIIKVSPSKSAEYLDYQLKSGKLYNPSNVNIGKVKELKLKGNDGEKIFGFRRIDDKRVYLFKYETLDNVKYLEMNWPTFENYAKELVNGKWGKITKNAAIGGVVDKEVKTEPKSSEEKKSDTPKNDGKTPTNLIIGDSQTPYVDSQTSKAQMISGPEGQTTLHKSGWSVDDLKNAVKKYPKSENVENVFLCIGTNGGYGNYKNDIGGLFDAVKETFPNAKIHVIQGSWGWGGVSKYNENDVRNYYKKYEAMGASLIEPPIGKIEPHGQKPVYKLIGAAIDSKI